jgi:hypothetical protein
MGVRIYQLYYSGGAAAAVAQVQVLRPSEVLCISFTGYAAVGNGSAAEVSTTAARQFATNNTQGILAIATLSVPAAGVGQLATNQFVPFPPGCKLGTGELVYLHTTQQGVGNNVTWTASIYVRE